MTAKQAHLTKEQKAEAGRAIAAYYKKHPGKKKKPKRDILTPGDTKI